MAWFEKEMNYAREQLTEAARESIAIAGDRLGQEVRDGAGQVGSELRSVVETASRELDVKLDKISAELHSQRQFTKDDVRELVDYAAERFSRALDERMVVARTEISDLVQEKVEYFKLEVDSFFIQRQKDLARERQRLWWNIIIAVLTSISVGIVSWFYQHMAHGSMDLFVMFRIVLGSLSGGYAVYLLVRLLLRWRSMAEHRKDAMFLAMRYWGALRPESVLMHVFLLLLILGLLQLVLFPDLVQHLPGGQHLAGLIRDMFPHPNWR